MFTTLKFPTQTLTFQVLRAHHLSKGLRAPCTQNKRWRIELLYRYKRAKTNRITVLNIGKLYLYFAYFKLYVYFQWSSPFHLKNYARATPEKSLIDKIWNKQIMRVILQLFLVIFQIILFEYIHWSKWCHSVEVNDVIILKVQMLIYLRCAKWAWKKNSSGIRHHSQVTLA